MGAAIYDMNGKEIKYFHVFKVDVAYTANVIGSPVETGQTSFDDKVIMPRQVTVSGKIVISGDGTGATAISQITEMFQSRDFKFCSVSNGVRKYNNLILKSVPMTRESDLYDWVSVELVFVEAMLVQAKNRKSTKSENADARALGHQSGS